MMDFMQGLISKAEILVEALPYIEKLAGKTVVVKYGGNAMINDELKHSVMEDLTLLKFIGINPVLVHGGGPDINENLKVFKIESKFENGLRVTDEATMKVAQMTLVGKTNKEIVALLNSKGADAIGLSGIDCSLMECIKLTKDDNGDPIDLGYVGKIVNVKADVIKQLINSGYIPVIAPIGADKQGNSYNINADTVANSIATALKAEKLMFLTDVEGVKDKDGNIMYSVGVHKAHEYIDNGIITGGMVPKVRACVDAVLKGVNRVHIIDGRIPHAILLEIFTDTGIGTMFGD
ncbi:MAG: acetylglutamate kinase [Clostridia bacterium]|nr:acetylglutamate kinase [Clostridia bacterium]